MGSVGTIGGAAASFAAYELRNRGGDVGSSEMDAATKAARAAADARQKELSFKGSGFMESLMSGQGEGQTRSAGAAAPVRLLDVSV